MTTGRINQVTSVYDPNARTTFIRSELGREVDTSTVVVHVKGLGVLNRGS